MKQLPTLKRDQLNKNGKKHIIMGNVVFDVTGYESRHPGKSILLKAQHTDGLQCLIQRHGRHMDVLEKRLLELAVGKLGPSEQQDLSEITEQFQDHKVLELFKRLFGPQ